MNPTKEMVELLAEMRDDLREVLNMLREFKAEKIETEEVIAKWGDDVLSSR